MAHPPGSVRDAIIKFLSQAGKEARVREIRAGISKELGDVPASSVRSYLNLNVATVFERTAHGTYRLKKKEKK